MAETIRDIWLRYEKEKKKLRKDLTPKEYSAAIREITDRLET